MLPTTAPSAPLWPLTSHQSCLPPSPGHRDTKPLAASVRLRRPLSRLRRYRCGNCTFVTIQVQGNHLARRPRDRPARWRAAARDRPSNSLLVSRRGGLCRGGLRLLAQRRKPSRIFHRQIGKDLAIQFDAGLLQAVDELAVTGSVQLGGSADAHNPDGTELALLLLAAAVGELQPAFDRLFRLTVQFGFC